ncbi:MAG: hypothetical protein ACI8UP_005404 [Porticoccaceae bacterium]|jgi:hypothetical protein
MDQEARKLRCTVLLECLEYFTELWNERTGAAAI